MSPVNELPVQGSQFFKRGPRALNRRQALSLLATGIASGLAACSKPDEQIVPYVRMPDRLTPGKPLKFATTLPLSGFGRGVLVTSIDGRPIKVEGNPRHPGSLGATDVFSEAAVLSLYDPDRSRTVLQRGGIASEDAFRLALRDRLQALKASGGEGFRLLTGRATSPTLLRQIDEVLKTFPNAAWHAYDPTDDNASAGAALAFGRPLQSVPRLDRARVLLSLDADPLGHGPDQLRHARGFAAGRLAPTGETSRIYSIEATPTLTGAKADHRLALPPELILEATVALANALGGGLRDAALPADAQRFLAQAARDLTAHQGQALVLAGPTLSPQGHALVHWINARLRSPIDMIDPATSDAGGRRPGALSDLATELADGKVRMLVMLEVNPAYDAPVDLEMAKLLKDVAFAVHLGGYADETAALSTWHVPRMHDLEMWSDLRSIDGAASVMQPLIRPLYRGWSEHDVLALLMDRPASAYDLVRETWRPNAGADFDDWWRRVLHDGVIAGNAAPVAPPDARLPEIPPAPRPRTDGFTLVLRPDPAIWDGRFANNAWLQECPKPLTKEVWGNALALNPQDARRLDVSTGDVVTVSAPGGRVDAPVIVQPGIADGVISLTLGYGRNAVGAIGKGVGVNAYALRTADAPWSIAQVTLAKTGRRSEILTTQNVVRSPDDVRELFPVRDIGAAPVPQTTADATPPSLLPELERRGDGAAWAMVIDTSVCIGCNACVVSCQAENNVPVVGPEEVARGRDMHWLRVDVYDHGSDVQTKPGFQPVPCMHCEHAPCEPVCPVAASVHDSEGLNVQVYNRCVGTRFCEANCPYKVRRFNFFGYADGQEYANLGFESYRGQRNPEVTVRARGVMEKCTYCVQRISAARRAAERDDRPIATDEVRTACQNACPTQAITFGDLNQAASMVNRQRTDDRHYALLGHLGTRPRTTYLADIRNAVPGFDEDRS
jgi:molybdopterin-containing oxidoreductase family iron-sulfur binding subunit